MGSKYNRTKIGSSKCKNSISEYFSISLNGIFHVLVLFTFLTILFFTLVSSLEKKAFEDEIEDQIDNSMKSIAKNISPKDKDLISNAINTQVGNNRPIDIAIDNYSKPTDVIVQHNKWIQLTAVEIIVSILSIFLIIVVVLHISCGKCIGVFDIIK